MKCLEECFVSLFNFFCMNSWILFLLISFFFSFSFDCKIYKKKKDSINLWVWSDLSYQLSVSEGGFRSKKDHLSWEEQRMTLQQIRHSWSALLYKSCELYRTWKVKLFLCKMTMLTVQFCYLNSMFQYPVPKNSG